MVVVITKAMEKSRFVRSDPSVHEVMRRLMSELTQRSNRGQPLVPTSLRRSELQYDLFIPRYEIQHPSSVSISMADHLKILGFVGGIFTQMFVRDKKVVLGLSAFARGMDRADEEKMCIESAPLPTTLIQSSEKKDPENMSDDDNEFKKQKIVSGLPDVGCGVDRADAKKMHIGRKPQLTTSGQLMASSSN